MTAAPLYGSSVNLVSELPLYDHRGHTRVVVEAPRGSAVKLKYDPVHEVFVWSRTLSLGVRFPYDFGFLPQTLADDHDAVDAVVFAEAGSFPGVVVPSRPIGALRVEQKRPGEPVKRNDRILVVPAYAHRGGQLRDIGDVPRRVRDELQAFFSASLMLTGKHVRYRGWADAKEATQLISDAHARYCKENTP